MKRAPVAEREGLDAREACGLCGSPLPSGRATEHYVECVRRIPAEALAHAVIGLEERFDRLLLCGIAADETSCSPVSKRILGALGNGKRLRIRQLAEEIVESFEVVRSSVKRMAKRGLVVLDGAKLTHVRIAREFAPGWPNGTRRQLSTSPRRAKVRAAVVYGPPAKSAEIRR